MRANGKFVMVAGDVNEPRAMGLGMGSFEGIKQAALKMMAEQGLDRGVIIDEDSNVELLGAALSEEAAIPEPQGWA